MKVGGLYELDFSGIGDDNDTFNGSEITYIRLR